MRRSQKQKTRDSSFKGKTVGGGLRGFWFDLTPSARQENSHLPDQVKLQVSQIDKRIRGLESRGETGNSDEAEERRVQDNTGSTVLVISAASAVDLTGAGCSAARVLVRLVVVGRAGEDALDLAIAALASGSRLL